MVTIATIAPGEKKAQIQFPTHQCEFTKMKRRIVKDQKAEKKLLFDKKIIDTSSEKIA